MPIITRREAARRLWSLARELDRKRIFCYPEPVALDRMTQDEVLLLATALDLGAEALEPLGGVDEDAFAEVEIPERVLRAIRRGARGR